MKRTSLSKKAPRHEIDVCFLGDEARKLFLGPGEPREQERRSIVETSQDNPAVRVHRGEQAAEL